MMKRSNLAGWMYVGRRYLKLINYIFSRKDCFTTAAFMLLLWRPHSARGIDAFANFKRSAILLGLKLLIRWSTLVILHNTPFTSTFIVRGVIIFFILFRKITGIITIIFLFLW